MSSRKLSLLPAKLTELIERGEEILPARKLFVRAVVGAVYFKGTNEALAEQAMRLATEHGMVVVRADTKDIVFLANYFETANWPLNIVAFFEALTQKCGSDVRFGASMGPAALLNTGGALRLESDENELAPRLARLAEPGQMMMTGKVWHSLSDALEGWTSVNAVQRVAGFPVLIPSIQLAPRLSATSVCPTCGKSLEVKQSAEGYIHVSCAKNHEQSAEPPPVRFKNAG